LTVSINYNGYELKNKKTIIPVFKKYYNYYKHLFHVYFQSKIAFFVFLFLILLPSFVNLTNNSAWGETTQHITIHAIEDSFVDEDLPQKKFGTKDKLATGWTNNKDRSIQDTMQALSYIKFSLNEIPESSNHDIITIDTITLDIWIEEAWWNEKNKHSFIVYPCFDNSWSEEEITWHTRPCKDNLENGVRTILEQSNIQKQQSIDIKDMIMNAKNQNLSEITLVLSSCSTEKGRIDCQENPGLIWIQSLESKDTGVNQIPKLGIQYTIEEEVLNFEKILTIIVVISVLTIPTILYIQYVRKRFPFRRFIKRKPSVSKN